MITQRRPQRRAPPWSRSIGTGGRDESERVVGIVGMRRLGVFAPLGTPTSIVIRLNAEMNKALLDKVVRERLLEGAQEPVGGPPEHLAKVMQQDLAKYARLARELKIKAE
ncbi:MAG: hypothetical protein JO320_11925 [Alphaproteobacteria bacterium]|nr:hypothetical protein [Alphaproteobacteria bacterium]